MENQYQPATPAHSTYPRSFPTPKSNRSADFRLNTIRKSKRQESRSQVANNQPNKLPLRETTTANTAGISVNSATPRAPSTPSPRRSRRIASQASNIINKSNGYVKSSLKKAPTPTKSLPTDQHKPNTDIKPNPNTTIKSTPTPKPKLTRLNNQSPRYTNQNQTTPSTSWNNNAGNFSQDTPICISLLTPKAPTPSPKDFCPCGERHDSLQINCDNCHQWWHSKCCNLSNNQATQYTSHNIWFNCLLCQLKHVSSNSNIIDTINKIKILKNKEAPGTQFKLATRNQTKPPEDNVEPANNPPSDCILIVDCADKENKLSDSNKIKAALLTTDPTIEINNTYKLAKGGIAIHCNNSPQTFSKLQSAAESTFPSGKFHTPQNRSNRNKVVAKNIPVNLSEQEIQDEIQTQIEGKVTVHRFKSRTKGNPFPVVSVEATVIATTRLLFCGLTLLGKKYSCAPFIKPVTRCYNCQGYGHIARNCRKIASCQRCGQHHLHNQDECKSVECCSNCKQQHSANSRLCPIYQDTKRKLHSHYSRIYNKNTTAEHNFLQDFETIHRSLPETL